MIPVSEPLLQGRELEFITDCVRSGWISSAGHYIEEFEQQWANYCGRRYGVVVSNGTTALQIAVALLNLQPGDEVILPSFTIISCAQAVLLGGGKPVLVDSEPRTWCMDVSQVETKITPKTRAIMVVHIYGHPVDMDPICQLADKYGLALIEDAAEAHGAEYLQGRETAAAHWQRCGSFGTLSTFSFYANKLVTTGEGGMVLTNDPLLAERARSLRNLCFVPGHRFYHQELGFNFRLTNMQAAIGLAQLEHIDWAIARKRAIAQEYARGLDGISVLQLPVEESWAHSIYWMYGMVVGEDAGMDAQALAKRLAARGVETRPFFLGMHEQPVLLERGLFGSELYPVASRLARLGLYLPSGLGLSNAQIATVCGAVRDSILA